VVPPGELVAVHDDLVVGLLRSRSRRGDQSQDRTEHEASPPEVSRPEAGVNPAAGVSFRHPTLRGTMRPCRSTCAPTPSPRPTPGMLAAMTSAPLGDDVLGDDPSVAALEARCAALTGQEAALFVPSGTMANLIAISVHTRPGDEVLLHEDAHPLHYEGAGASAIAGVQLRPLPGPRGALSAAVVEAAVRPDGRARAALVARVPRGHPQPRGRSRAAAGAGGGGAGGGRAPRARLAPRRGPPVRRRGWPRASRWAGAPRGSRRCRCVSRRGWGAPRARCCAARRPRWRPRAACASGSVGGMRQSGMLAAAASYALDHHVARLAEDHALAREGGDGA
jgi:threonine aldolase